MVLGLFKGYRNGFVVAVFSFLAFFIGLAAAVKLSVVVSRWLQTNTHVDLRWLSFLSFILVIMVVALLIRWGALLIQGSLDFIMLGWLNKLAGVFFLYRFVPAVVKRIVVLRIAPAYTFRFYRRWFYFLPFS